MDLADRLTIRPMSSDEGALVRAILHRIGWEEQYVRAATANVLRFADSSSTRAAFVAEIAGDFAGFIFVELHQWNQLAQIEGLAVDPARQRQGVAQALVQRSELFAQRAGARGIFVDTPTDNLSGRAFYMACGYQEAYTMPRYYEDALDGVTYQKFFAP